MKSLSNALRPLATLLVVVAAGACSDRAIPVAPTAPAAPAVVGHPQFSTTPSSGVAYTVNWSGGEITIFPIERAMTVEEYYSYNSPAANSANPPDGITDTQNITFFLYRDTNTGIVSLVMMVGKTGGTSAFHLIGSVSGLPSGAAWTVEDDPGDSYALSDGTATFDWTESCCTDGGAVSGLNGGFDLKFNFTKLDGITRGRVYSGHGTGTPDIQYINWDFINRLEFKATVTNMGPTAVATAPAVVNLDGSTTASVALDGSGSSDPDNGPSPLTYTWSENGSPIATGATPTISASIGSHTYTLVVSDGLASGSTTVTVDVVDPTPPTVTATVSGTAGNSGWYTSDATVAWTVTDLESTASVVDGCTGGTATDGSTTFTCKAESAGGTTEKSVTVQMDSHAPTVAFAGNLGSYGLTDQVDITCTDGDTGSGIATASCPTASGEAYTLGVGEHTLNATATDVAGNTASASITFTVSGDAGSVCGLIDSWLSGHRLVTGAMCALLKSAERATARGNTRVAGAEMRAFRILVRVTARRWLTDSQAAFLLSLD